MNKIYVHGIEMYEQCGIRAYSEAGLRKSLEEANGRLVNLSNSPYYTLDYATVREQGKRIDLQNAKKIGKVKYVPRGQV